MRSLLDIRKCSPIKPSLLGWYGCKLFVIHSQSQRYPGKCFHPIAHKWHNQHGFLGCQGTQVWQSKIKFHYEFQFISWAHLFLTEVQNFRMPFQSLQPRNGSQPLDTSLYHHMDCQRLHYLLGPCRSSFHRIGFQLPPMRPLLDIHNCSP